IGELSPSLKCSTSFIACPSALFDGARFGEPGECLEVGRALGVSYSRGVESGVDVRLVLERTDHLDQRRSLQKRKPASAEVVGERAEGLGPQRDSWGAPVGPSRLEVSRHRTCRRWRPPRPGVPPRPWALRATAARWSRTWDAP